MRLSSTPLSLDTTQSSSALGTKIGTVLFARWDPFETPAYNTLPGWHGTRAVQLLALTGENLPLAKYESALRNSLLCIQIGRNPCLFDSLSCRGLPAEC